MIPWIDAFDAAVAAACGRDVIEEEALEELFEMNPVSDTYNYKVSTDCRGTR